MRRDVPGLINHVTAKAVDGQQLFRDDLDRHAYLGRVTAVVHRFGIGVLDFCLMGNHVHVLVRAEAATLSRAMQDLHGGYARAFNDRHERRGHLFAGRFKGRPVLSSEHLHGCLRYIARNPVEALVVPRPGDWSWSGYRALAGEADPLPFHATEETLRLLAPDLPAGRNAFLAITSSR